MPLLDAIAFKGAGTGVGAGGEIDRRFSLAPLPLAQNKLSLNLDLCLSLSLFKTGPLGQGICNAVGLAAAEAHLAARFNKPDAKVVDHYTYCIMGDGKLFC